jgi:flagellar protein FliS
MRANSRAIQSYGDVKVSSGVATANNVQLIQMLFDGLLESLSTARGHIQHKNINEKSKAIARASRIVIGLQGALDFEKGGDLANNLNELYSYVTRRLFHVNAHNSVEPTSWHDELIAVFFFLEDFRYLSVNLAGCSGQFLGASKFLTWVRQPAWGEC